MNLQVLFSGSHVYTHCECILGFSFKMDAPRGRSAIFGFNPAKDRGQSTRISQAFSLTRDMCAHFDLLTQSGLSPLERVA